MSENYQLGEVQTPGYFEMPGVPLDAFYPEKDDGDEPDDEDDEYREGEELADLDRVEAETSHGQPGQQWTEGIREV